MKLYELSAEYRRISGLIEEDTSPEEVEISLALIEGEIRGKATNIAMLIEETEASAAAIREAEKRMADRRRSLENQAERIRTYLLNNMVATGTTLIECPHFKIAIRDKPAAVIVEDEALIPAEYMRQPPAVPDKKKIMDDLKEGVVIDGVRSERGKTLQIK